jgi:CIC family chloride channel protein
LKQQSSSRLSSFRSRFSSNQFLLIASSLVGLVSGLAAVALKTAVYAIHQLLTTFPRAALLQYIYLLFPLGGILLTVAFIHYFLKDSFGKGSAHVLYTIARKSSNIERQMTYSHIITSALTVGFGGSAGLEAPIVVTGSAIGSNFGRLFQFHYRERTVLLAAGAAAGIAAVFNAPIAGLMFAIEVLIVDLSLSSFIPLIIASATGALLSKMILNENILFFFTLRQPFNYFNVPYYFGLGLLTGFISIYYIRTFVRIEAFFKLFREHRVLKAVTGGLILGLLILIFPPLFGEGYQSIKYLANETPRMLLQDNLLAVHLQNEWIFLLFIFMVGITKIVAASMTIGSGGNGGNFAPSLFVGAFSGYAYAKFLNQTFHLSIPVGNFSLVGMAGILCGVMHAPLTAVFLIAEITGGYELMIPLLIVSSVTFVLVRHFEPYSLDKKDLARRGDLLTENKDKNILSLLSLSEVIEQDYTTVPRDATLNDLTTIISSSKRNIFPVLDESEKLLGIITLDEIKEMLFELEDYSEILAVELMNRPAAVVEKTESLESIMQKFETTKKWNLPVVDNSRYVGFVSKSGILSRYREHLRKNFSVE